MENKSYKVSFIVPAYNVQDYIESCLNSLVNQTLSEIEIIVVDDGSNDNTGRICDVFMQKYKNIKVIHKKNEGLGMARNTGLDVAGGEYIGFVDSDDFVSLDMAKVLYQNAVQYDADISYGNIRRFFETKRCRDNHSNQIRIFSNEDIVEYLFGRIGNMPGEKEDTLYAPVVCNGIFKRRIFEEHNIKFVSERELIGEDIIFDIDFIQKCRTVIHSDKIVYFYRYNPKSLTTRYVKDRFEQNIQLIHAMKERLKDYSGHKRLELALDRYFIAFSRFAVIQEVIHTKGNGFRYALKRIKRICENEELRAVIERYPYRRLPLRYSIYCWMQHRELTYLLMLCTWVIQRIKGKIKK